MIEIPIGPNVSTAWFLGGLLISWHGFFSFIAVALAVVLIGRWAPLRGIDPDVIYSTAVWVIIGGIVGARIVHVIDFWGYYSNNLEQVLFIWNGGIGLWGGILGGFSGGAVYTIFTRQPLGVIADMAAPAVLFAQAIGRVGDIVNGEHCARETDFFLGFAWTHVDSAARSCVSGWHSSVQPVILYEILWTMAILSLLWYLKGRLMPDGMSFALYLALYSLGRFVITFAREDKVWGYGMQEAQYIALVVLIITIPILVVKARYNHHVDKEFFTDEPPKIGTRAERRRTGN